MIRMVAKLVKVLNSEADPGQISLAFSFSMASGFLPFFSPINLVILLTVCLLRVNLSAYFLGAAFFSGLAYALDPLFHPVGYALLTSPSLEGIWTSMYNTTIWRVQKFNNSIVMGSFAVSVLLFIPLLLISNMMIRRYREHFLAWIRQTRLMKVIMASDFYRYYQTLSGWRSLI